MGGLGRSSPGTATLANSARVAPVAEAVPGADGAAPMAVARVASVGACPAMERGPLSRALHAAIGVKRANSEATAAASTCTARAAPEASAPTRWDGHDVDGCLGSTKWAGSESMAAARSRMVAAMTQVGRTREVRRGNTSTWGG
jgi:hypothetical protein